MPENENYYKIIEAFYQLVAQKGYANASMSSVTKKAQVSKGAIYHYFSGKEELFAKTINFVFESSMEEEKMNFEKVTKDNYKEVILEMGRSFIKDDNQTDEFRRFMVEFITESLRNDTMKSMLNESIVQYMDIFMELIAKLKEIGVVEQDKDSKILAQKLFILMDSFILYSSLDIKVMDLDKLWESFIEDIL